MDIQKIVIHILNYMKYFILSIITLLGFSPTLPGQDAYLDSLKQVLKRQTGAVKTQNLLQLAYLSYEYDINQALAFATEAYVLAQKTGDRPAEKYALTLQGEYYYNINDFKTARSFFQRSGSIKAGKQSAIEGYNQLLWANTFKVVSQDDSAALHFKQAIPLLEAAGNPDFLSYGYVSMIHWHCDQYQLDLAKQYLDKVYQLALQYPNSPMMVEVLVEKGRILDLEDAYNDARNTLLEALKRMPESTVSHTKITCLYLLCRVEYNQGNYQQASSYFPALLNNNGDELCATTRVAIYHVIGNIYLEKGKYDAALKFYLDAVRIMSQIGMQRELGHIYSDIAWLYFKQFNDHETLSFVQKSIALNTAIKDEYGLAHNHSILGSLYTEQGKSKAAVEEHNKAIQIWQKLGTKARLSCSFYNLSSTYEHSGDIDMALYFTKKCLAIDESLNSTLDLGLTHKKIAGLYFQQKNYKASKFHLDKADEFAQKTTSLELKRDVSALYTDWYEYQGNYQLANQFLRKMLLYKDTLLNLEGLEKTAELRALYELDNLENRNKQQEQVLALERLGMADHQNRYLLISIILILVSALFLIAIGFYVYGQRKNKKLQTEIAERVQLESDLKKSNERWQVAINGSNDGLWDWDIETKTVYYSPRWEEMFGYKPGELPQKMDVFSQMVHPDDLDSMFEEVNRYLRGETKFYSREFRMFHRNGALMWTLHRAAGIFSEDGTAIRMIGTTADITQRKNAETALLKNQLIFEESQALAHVGSWEYDLQTGALVWSKETHRIFELENQDSASLYEAYRAKCHPDDLEKLDQAIQNTLETGQQFHIEHRIICKGGTIKYISCIGEIVINEHGQTIGLRGTDQDITLQKQVALAKSEFLSVMSHEIRTPINGVVGIANLLMTENLNATQQDYVNTLRFSANHLSNIVSDILDFSKIESGNIQIEKNLINIKTITEQVFKLFEHRAQEKNIQCLFNPDPNISFLLLGDDLRISQILSNLLSNAIKFTQKGTIEFSYLLQENTIDNAHILFTIKDSGIGISPKELGTIFENFTQANSGIARIYGGTGLGLAICKKLVEQLGGNIRVESQVGKGSIFYVDLVFEKHRENTNQGADKYPETFPQNPIFQGMNILVAEDNQINAMIITRFLDKWNAQYNVVKNGKEALKSLEKDPYDMVLMDIQMPVMDGNESIRLMRQSKKSRIQRTPVIAFTADASITTHHELIKNGFNDCLTKPFHPNTLYQILSKYYQPS
jgi:PAS domain S-box-containing protein